MNVFTKRVMKYPFASTSKNGRRFIQCFAFTATSKNATFWTDCAYGRSRSVQLKSAHLTGLSTQCGQCVALGSVGWVQSHWMHGAKHLKRSMVDHLKRVPILKLSRLLLEVSFVFSSSHNGHLFSEGARGGGRHSSEASTHNWSSFWADNKFLTVNCLNV